MALPEVSSMCEVKHTAELAVAAYMACTALLAQLHGHACNRQLVCNEAIAVITACTASPACCCPACIQQQLLTHACNHAWHYDLTEHAQPAFACRGLGPLSLEQAAGQPILR